MKDQIIIITGVFGDFNHNIIWNNFETRSTNFNEREERFKGKCKIDVVWFYEEM